MKKVTLDLSKADQYTGPTETEVLVDELKAHGLYEENCLYTVIDGEKLDEFLEHGTYRPDDVIYAFGRDELVWRGDYDDLRRHIEFYQKPAIAVYNRSHFDVEEGGFTYRFKNPGRKREAVVGVIERIKWVPWDSSL